MGNSCCTAEEPKYVIISKILLNKGVEKLRELIKADTDIIRELIDNKEYDRAITVVEEALIKFPNCVELLSMKGQIYFIKKDWKKVIDISDEILNHQHSITTMVNKANALEKLGKFEEALHLIEEILHKDEYNLKAYVIKILSLQQLQKFEEGLKETEISLEKFGQNSHLIILRAQLLFKLCRYLESKASFELCMELYPEEQIARSIYDEFKPLLEKNIQDNIN
jgi:tetratricopeptide (TPR) repeat protein